MPQKIPVYSINTFKRSQEHPEYQVEVFNKDRNFRVSYPHRHDFYEILFIVEGTGSYTIDFNDYSIIANTIFFVSPGQVHTIDYSENVLGYIFLFTSEFYLMNKQDKNKLTEFPFFNHFSGNTPPLDLKEIEFMTNLFAKACEEQKRSDIDSEEMTRALLDIILINCKRFYPVVADEKQAKGKVLVKKFNVLIEEKYLLNYAVKEYAEMLNVTPNHLNESVKTHLGKTASQLIDDKVILEIKRILVHTDLNVNEISEKFGFIDQSYFSKYFKKLVGKSPKEFRNEIQLL